MILSALRAAAPIALAALLAAPAALPSMPAGEALAPAALADPSFPDTPAGRCARDFLAMVADGSPAAVRRFEETWASSNRLAAASIDDRAPRIAEMHAQWSGVRITGVTPAKGAAPLVVRATLRNGDTAELEFRLDPAESGKLEAVMIALEPSGGGDAPPLTPDARRAAVESACKALREHYVYPEVGDQMSAAVLARLTSGEYDAITDPRELARRLTDDFRAVSRDKHLRVRSAPPGARPPGPTGEGASHADRARMRRENYAFRKVELLPENIGYLRFDAFVDDDEARATAAAAMAFLRHSDALIIDLRHNGGGSPSMIAFLSTYLFDTRTHLNDMKDRTGAIIEEFWTLDSVPGQRLPADLPVFVLTSARTFSGAEEFSYNLKHLERATIIGETTGGGAHPVRGQPLSGGFMIGIPFLRACNPITGTNWEGAGVAPDIATPAAEALDRALAEARAAIARRAPHTP